jgi:hypothetical protein
VAENPAPFADKDDADSADDADEKILESARSRFQLAAEAESDMREQALDDYRFRAGEQWDDTTKNQRHVDNRPCLVINRLPQFVRQITNDQRQNRPCIKVDPCTDDADEDTAKVFQGLIKDIENDSGADAAYDTGFDGAVTGGFGYIRVATDYVSDDVFDQKLLIKRIRNPFMVYFDPAAKEADGSDAEFAFVVDDMLPEAFKREFPKADASKNGSFESLGDQAADWMPGDKIRVAEYFYKKYEKKKLYMLQSGTVTDTLPDDHDMATVKQTRDVMVAVVKWAKITGVDVLDKGTWVSKFIPIVPVYGEELDVNGKIIRSGIIRSAKDSQRMYNYMASYEAETIALAPRAPFIGVAGQFEKQPGWDTANTRNHAYLQYNPTTINGQPAPPPQRQVFEPAIQSISMARNQAADDIKSVTGIFDSALGNAPNDASGIAIQRRNTQTQTSNFHFVDNFHRSLRHVGAILVDAIPKVYDAARAVRIIKPDGQQEVLTINKVFEEGKDVKAHNMGVGRYQVVLDTGPSYATKRQEAVTSMLDLAGKLPQVGQVAPDLLVNSMDFPGAQDMAARLKKTVAPNLLDDGKGQPQVPPQAQQQMAQMSQMIQSLSKQVHDAHDALEMKKPEIESRERIAMAKIQCDLEIALAQIGQKDAVALLENQVASIMHQAELSHAAEQSAQQMANQPPQQQPGQPQDPNAAGPSGAEQPQGNIPTGGASPGQPMGQP